LDNWCKSCVNLSKSQVFCGCYNLTVSFCKKKNLFLNEKQKAKSISQEKDKILLELTYICDGIYIPNGVELQVLQHIEA
jgi:hypothetical protein